MTLQPFFSIWLGFFGLAIGSFLNVVIARLPLGESIVQPGSKCLQCGIALHWYENIPLLSWVLQGGRCRHCKAAISPRYIFVELLTGMLFMLCLVRFGWTWSLVSALTLVTLVLPLIFIDAVHWVLPFEITLPGIALAVLVRLPEGLHAVQMAGIGIAAGFCLFRVMEFGGWAMTGQEALGAGDKYFIAMVLGFLGWRALLSVVLFASLQAITIGVLYMRLRGKRRRTEGRKNAESANVHPIRQHFTPVFLAPGLSVWKRVILVPYALLFQDVPDLVLDAKTGKDTWQPQPNNIPFGPWIGLAALEVMLLGPYLAKKLSGTVFEAHGQLLFG